MPSNSGFSVVRKYKKIACFSFVRKTDRQTGKILQRKHASRLEGPRGKLLIMMTEVRNIYSSGIQIPDNARNKYSCTRNVQEYSFLRKPGKYIPGEFIFLRGVRWSGIKFREFKLPLFYRNFSSRNLTPELLFLAIIRNLYSWLGIVFLKNSGILIPEKNSSRKIYSQKKSLRKIIPGINLPEECWFLRNSRKTPSL